MQLVPVNRTGRDITYGLPYELERRDGTTWVRVPTPPGLAFTQQLLVAQPGRSGPCASALVVTSADRGRYRVTISAASPLLRTEFTVAGATLPPSDIERSLRETEDDPPSETTTVPDVEDDPSGTGPGAPEPGLQPVP